MPAAYRIQETNDFYPLSLLFRDSGMEIQPSHEPPAGLIKMWRLEDAGTGELLAAVTMETRDGVPVLGDLGVRPDLQRTGCGKLLQEVVFDEARRMGIRTLWGSAKVPDYYCRLGWERVDWDSAPRIAVNCDGCTRRGDTCHPAILKRTL